MAWRTTADAVKLILDFDPVNTIDPFIDTANNVVTNVCGAAGYSDETLELIERWLAAHYYCTLDPQYAAEKTLQAGVQFHGKTGKYLEASIYGQQAMSVDFKGLLAAWNKQMQSGGPVEVGAQWLGKDDPYGRYTDGYQYRDDS